MHPNLELTQDSANVLRAMALFRGKVGLTAAEVSLNKKTVLRLCNDLIELGMLDDDGLPTAVGQLWIIRNGNGTGTAAKPSAKVKPAKPDSPARSINLRCPTCKYFAKTSSEMMTKGRLKCPVDGTLLATKEERGEKKGRY